MTALPEKADAAGRPTSETRSAGGALSRLATAAPLLAIVGLATYVRLWHLGRQIPLDDEWHGLAYVLGHDLGFLLTHYTRLGANSVPQNLYLRLVYRTLGLSEWSIVLPSLLGGIALVWLVARWLGRKLGAAAGLVSGVVLALSPFLVFYSRFARPYAPLLLLEFLALAHLGEWMRTGTARGRRLAVLFAALAIWTHLTAVAALVGAWLAAVVWQWRRREPRQERAPGPLHVLRSGGVVALVAALLCLPGLLNRENPAPAATAPFAGSTFERLTQLLCGTGALHARVLVGLATIAGIVVLCRRAPRELALVVAAAAGAVVAVLVAHPELAEVGAIFARYSLPLFLLVPLGLGAAAQWLMDHLAAPRAKRITAVAGMLGLPAALYLSGPLPQIYWDPDSFTKHPVYQYQYVEVTAERSLPDPVVDGARQLGRGELHPFYEWLGREPRGTTVIEYPFVLGEDHNRLYFPQLVHRQPVLAGYYASGAGERDWFGLALARSDGHVPPAANAGFVTGAMTVDHVLGRLGDRAGIRLRTVVDLGSAAAIRASGARYVILHRNPPRELERTEVDISRGEARSRFVDALRQQLAADWGEPMLDDGTLVVFSIR